MCTSHVIHELRAHHPSNVVEMAAGHWGGLAPPNAREWSPCCCWTSTPKTAYDAYDERIGMVREKLVREELLGTRVFVFTDNGRILNLVRALPRRS